MPDARVSSAGWRAVFLIGDVISEAVDGCTCGTGPRSSTLHEAGCGLEPVGTLATPAHNALVRDRHGEAIAEAIEESAADVLAHEPCMRLSCALCAQRALAERVIRIARYSVMLPAGGDGR